MAPQVPSSTRSLEVVVDGPPAGEVAGQGPPGEAVAGPVEDGIDDLAEVGLAGPPQLMGGGARGFEQGPLGIGQVTGIGFGSHPLSTSESVLWNRLIVLASARNLRGIASRAVRMGRIDS